MPYRKILLSLTLVALGSACMAAPTTLKLATLEYPPYIINSEHGAQGLAVDIVRAAFARIGQPIQIQFYPTSRGAMMLQTGRADGYFSIKKTAERQTQMRFTQEPLYHQEFVFFTRKDALWQFTGNFDSLANARIGIIRQTSYGNRFDRAARAGRFKRLEDGVSYEGNFRKLLAGRLDAVICSRLVGLYYLQKLNSQKVVNRSGPTVEAIASYLVFSRQKDHSALARKFDQTLEDLEHDGTLRRLMNIYHLPHARLTETPSQ